MNPLVSVIIPVFNGAQFLREALDSVLAQDYEPFEVLVADDGSTDESVAIAESFPGVTVLRLAHGGVSRARNAAVARSNGDWLAFLDCDDVWLPGKLAAQVAVGQADAGIGLVLCHQRMELDGERPSWFVRPVDGVARAGFEPSSWLVRRATFEAVGPFERGRTLGEDMNWLARAWAAGVRHQFVEELFVRRRIHDANVSAQLPGQQRQVLDFLRESLALKRARQAAIE